MALHIKSWFLYLLPLTLFAGQSLVLTPGVTSSSASDPNQSTTTSWRAEFQIHGHAIPGSDSNLFDYNGIGMNALLKTNGTMQLLDKRDSNNSVCSLDPSKTTNGLVRVQRNYPAMTFIAELWNYDGTGYQVCSTLINTANSWAFSGGKVGDFATTANLGFLKIFSTLVPVGSTPPVTASVGDITNLKFDGAVTDTSGNGHNVTFAGATYVTTPNQSPPVSVIKTLGTPSWSSWVSMRAGNPATLDGTSSFSLADSGSTVTYFWQQLSGPSSVTWSSRTAAQPVINGTVFGSYVFQLTVTDPAGVSAVSTLDVGCVATDANGVVVQANPAADLLFGPMIAFGKNPWPFQDYITLHSAQIRSSYIASQTPEWTTLLPGTISFTPWYGSSPNRTSINGAILSTDQNIVVNDITKIDITTLPTVVIISLGGAQEEVRICSVAGSTLTACYDGRGWRQGLYSEASAPQAWGNGTSIEQLKTTGTGTTFLSDFCPAGYGEEGQISYNTGTVGVTAGSNTITGSGTAWTNALDSNRIRISGHHGGVAFAFFATITTTGSTGITLSRAYPSTADTESGLTYAIIHPGKQLVRQWLRPDTTTGQQLSGVSSCENNTSIYTYSVDGISNSSTSLQIGQHYSKSSQVWAGEFGPNYYDEVFAHYAEYFRSGNSLFLNNARGIGDYWDTMPELDQGYVNTTPRHAGMTGQVAAAVLDNRPSKWYTIRQFDGQAIASPFSGGIILPDCDSDLREGAYGLSWVALSAMFDPVDTGSPTTPGQRSYWKAKLADAYTRDNGCKGPQSEFPQSYYNGAGGAFSMTHGSTTATGTAIPTSLCANVTTGSVTVTNGSTAVTGTNFTAGNKMIIRAQRGGSYYLFYSSFSATSSTVATLSSPFDGTSGTYTYAIENDDSFLSFGANSGDHTNINTFYTCVWNSSTSITLDHGWEGTTGTYNASRSVDVGYGQTVFLMGLKTTAMHWAALGASGATATNYGNLATASAAWILGDGFDPVSKGLYYKREFYACEPVLNPRFNCMYDGTRFPAEAARTLNGEAQNAMRIAYEANPSPANLTFGDQFYGAQWGKLGGPYSDSYYLESLDSDSTFSYKWIGFLFGMGMSHQWPAARLGGVAPAVNRSMGSGSVWLPSPTPPTCRLWLLRQIRRLLPRHAPLHPVWSRLISAKVLTFTNSNISTFPIISCPPPRL